MSPPPVLNESQRKFVYSVYFDKGGPGSYSTPENLFRVVHVKDSNITLQAVKHWWNNQKNNVFNKKLAYSTFPRSVSIRYAYTNPTPMVSLSMDTMMLPGTGIPFVYITICNFSNYVFASPAKRNNTRYAERAMQQCLSSAENKGVEVRVTTLYTDEGTEYTGKAFNKYLDSKGIHHYYMRGQHKAFRYFYFIF